MSQVHAESSASTQFNRLRFTCISFYSTFLYNKKDNAYGIGVGESSCLLLLRRLHWCSHFAQTVTPVNSIMYSCLHVFVIESVKSTLFIIF
jgi:hypothetical protein